ncbi:Alpha/Beta hydrolase protein [Ilyonectria destructans]|nr:Alpha/Beta hydrolase protein [Ilyonectria destructans]
MAAKNVNLVQLAYGNASSTPLVLLHDGGGTVLSYQALGPLDRDVYGISDPRFDIGRPWDGGIPEMARVYAEMIKTRIPHKSILIGGWSFGGFLALEIAHLVAQSNDDSLHIAGLIFIDTPYPKVMENTNVRLAINSHLPDLVGVKPQLRRKIHSSIKNARSMLAAWQPPKWDPASECGDLGMKNPPPTILLRAASALTSRKNEPVAVVDVFRHDPKLGWNEYETAFIQVVWDIPGNHHSIFGAPNVGQVTARLGNACSYLCRAVTV